MYKNVIGTSIKSKYRTTKNKNSCFWYKTHWIKNQLYISITSFLQFGLVYYLHTYGVCIVIWECVQLYMRGLLMNMKVTFALNRLFSKGSLKSSTQDTMLFLWIDRDRKWKLIRIWCIYERLLTLLVFMTIVLLILKVGQNGNILLNKCLKRTYAFLISSLLAVFGTSSTS